MSSEYAVRFQEMIAKMPNTLTVKEVDEYCKNAKKEIKVKIGEETKVKKTAVQKKRAKKVDVDEEGNEVVKVKKPLNAYQQFIRDNRQKVKDEHPDAKGDEIFTMIATLWNKHKEDMKNKDGDDSDNDKSTETASVAVVDSEEDGDIKRDDEDDKKKEKKKEKKEKKEKKDKKAKKSSD
jgi:nucleolar protein 6